MTYKRFMLKKPYTCPSGTLSAGTEINFLDGRLYVNGGMVDPMFYDIIMDLISIPELRDEYVKEVVIPINKA